MAKTTRAKKTKVVPEVNVGKEIFESLRERRSAVNAKWL